MKANFNLFLQWTRSHCKHAEAEILWIFIAGIQNLFENKKKKYLSSFQKTEKYSSSEDLNKQETEQEL